MKAKFSKIQRLFKVVCGVSGLVLISTSCSKTIDYELEEQMPTLKSLTAYEVENKSGYSNYYYYSSKFTSGTYNLYNDRDGSSSTLPATTGSLFGLDGFVTGGDPTLTGNYYYAIGLLFWNPNVGNNGTTNVTNYAISKGILNGTGKGIGYGMFSYQHYGPKSGTNINITNAKTLIGQVNNNDGTAAGLYHSGNNGGVKVTNNSGATMSATARYFASGSTCNNYFGAVNFVNKGTATATATGGTSGNSNGKAYATGIDLFSYDASSTHAAPIYFENTGTIIGKTTGGTTQKAYGAFAWAQGGTLTWKNSGTITSSSTSASDARCEAVYCGANYGNTTVTNSGSISGTAGGRGGWGLGVENGQNYTITVTNSGSINHNNGYGVAAFSGTGNLNITNTGTIKGGLGGIATQTFKGVVTVNVSAGTVSGGSNAMVLGANNDKINLSGLPTITGTIDGNGGTNTLYFNLSGTLQKVNGVTATKGRYLSAYGLGTSGNISVSGKTYTWKNCNVTGQTSN
jgi:hypothetical protein